MSSGELIAVILLGLSLRAVLAELDPTLHAFIVMGGVLSMAIVIFVGIGWMSRYSERKLDEYDARVAEAKSKMTKLNDEGHEE